MKSKIISIQSMNLFHRHQKKHQIRVCKNILLFAGLLTGIGTQAQLTQTENYIYSKTCLDADCVKQAATVTYFDGLGRPKQNIAIKASTGGNDIATPIGYDGFGRQDKDYLPLPQPNSSTNGGAIFNAPSSAAYPSGEVVFSEKKFENSPLNRIEHQYGVGEAWKNNSKKTEFFYETNANDVKKYTTSFDYTTFRSSLPTITSYAAGTLYKNIVKDEDGNTTIEYKNGVGQTLLVRKFAGSTTSQGFAPIVNNIYVDTYYVYNDYNQLAFVISPLASRKTTLTTDDLDNLCYQYRYDGKNRLVEKKLPGKEWEHLLYDKQDRLVGAQDGLMRLADQWMFTKYDQFGRVVYTGIQIDSRTRAEMQNSIDINTTNPQNNESRHTPPIANSGVAVYYNNTAFPIITSTTKLLSVNYYDSYPGSGVPFDNILEQSTVTLLTAAYTSYGTTVRSLKGLPTASFINNIEANGWTRNYTFYDLKARPFATYSFNYLGGYTKTESELDFAGTPQKTFTFHKRLSTDEIIKIKQKFDYNQYTNALEKHYHEVVGKSPEEILSENSYNELGHLTNKKVGNNIQSIDYTYNIRGWMTAINNPKALNGKLFGFSLNYQSPLDIINTSPYSLDLGLTVQPKYNGNISEATWASGATLNPVLKKYGYVYDKMNRLRAGFYYTGSQYVYNNENFEILKYDENGNILDLKRSSFYSGTSTNLIDNLEYTYQGGNRNSNRLTMITDHSQNPSGYEGGANRIGYDANGNMVNMLDKGIQNISYNHLNLPKLIEVIPDDITNSVLEYHYRADGTKLKKVNTTTIGGIMASTTSINIEEYLDGFQYYRSQRIGEMDGAAGLNKMDLAMEEEAFTKVEKAVPGDQIINPPAQLQFFPTAEGFYDYLENKYIYQYKDHLGNTRMSYSWNPSTNSIDVQDENDFYPYGMNHIDPNSGSYFGTGSYKNYKYNGKELQETGMYDYGARFYMADIGRWPTMDGKGELYLSKSPYSYANNTPINAIDPDGNLVIFINGMHNDGSGGKPDYWRSKDHRIKFDVKVMDRLKDHEPKYVDGSFGGSKRIIHNFYSDSREYEGAVQGRKDAAEIIKQLARDTTTGEIVETIKIITHSMGGAYGKGYVRALKRYISSLPREQQKQIKITLVADFDPFQAESMKADEDIYTQQFSHVSKKGRKDSDGHGGLANEKQSGLDYYREDEYEAGHNILTFVNDIVNLQEGTYKWNGHNWVCSNCK